MIAIILADGTTQMPPIEMDSIVKFLAVIHNYCPLVGTLILTMGIDILVGLCAAYVTKSLSSTISHNGMFKKAIQLLVVCFGASIEPYAGGVPISGLLAMMFIATEGLSIVENAARAGVPIPQSLLDTLQKLKGNEKASVELPRPPAQVQINRVEHVDIKTTDSPSSKPDSVIIKGSESAAHALDE